MSPSMIDGKEIVKWTMYGCRVNPWSRSHEVEVYIQEYLIEI